MAELTNITDFEDRGFSEIMLSDFSIKSNDIIFVKTTQICILMKYCVSLNIQMAFQY